MKILEMPACPVCGNAGFRRFELGAGNRLRRCTVCDTVSVEDYADPSEVYVDGYMFGEAGPFGLDVRAPEFQRYLLRVAQRRVALIERATGLHGASLLDVGSGTGEVLLSARDRGWRTQGAEPERTAARMAQERGLDVAVASLEQSGLPEHSYDVVSAFHVLEHIPDSRSFLRTMARWARPGGFVVVEVPNFASVQRRRLGEGWSGLRPREHLVHFTPKTLPAAFRAAGIEPVLVRSPAYIGPPQTLDQALWDLVRPAGRLRRLLAPICRVSDADANGNGNGGGDRGDPGDRDGRGDAGSAAYPTAPAWAVLRLIEAVYDAAGAGAVVLCIGRVR